MDYGSRYTDKRLNILSLRLQKVYREAQKDLEGQLDTFLKGHMREGTEMLKKLADGDISPDEYHRWMRRQVFIGKKWQSKIDHMTDLLKATNEKALGIVRGEQFNVFAENANYESFSIEKDYGGAVSFDIYDEATVERLVEKKPELLPRKTVNGRKDKAWNQGVISNAVTQAIIQGESIPKLARRLSRDTANTNMKAMVRYARTAMTGAQNAGRMETMHRAQDMGIQVQKQWLATLDRRTRDSHRHLDGQIRDVDKPFESDYGEIMFPGDPEANPGDVYNCRCTLVYVYPEYKNRNVERREEGGDLVEDITYDEWVKGKEFYKPPKVKTEATETNKSVPEGSTAKTEVGYTREEENSVEWYVSGEGQWINQYLRNPSEFGELSEYEKEQLQLLDSATEKQEITDNKLYRAVDAQAVFGRMSDMEFDNLKGAVIYGDNSIMSQTALEKAKRMIGKEVTEKGFMSTTRDMDTAAGWNGYTGSTKDIMLVLDVPDGIKGFDVEKHFEVEGEEQREVLLQRGLTYKVNDIGKQETEEGTVIVVEVKIMKKKRQS